MKRKEFTLFKLPGMPFVVILSVFMHLSSNVPVQALENPEPVTMAAYAGDTGLLVYVAQAQKYFSENGLNVSIKDYEAGKLAVDALIEGKADVATATDFVFVTQKFKHPDLAIIGTIAVADMLSLVARRDRGIAACKDLRGKRIGVTRKSSGEFNLGLFLLPCGLLLDDVKIVDLNPGEILKAMVEGRIDAAETWEPLIYETKGALGERAVVLPNQLDHHFYFVLICKKAWLREHKRTAERLLKAIVAAEKYVKENREAAILFAATKFGLDRKYVDYAFRKHQFSVLLPQTLLLRLEDQARWRLKNHLSTDHETPNYLDSLIMEPMLMVKPSGVTLFR